MRKMGWNRNKPFYIYKGLIQWDNVITPTLNTPTVITPTLITPTIIIPTLDTSTVTDSLWNSGALSSTLKSFVCNGALHVSLQHLQWMLSPLFRFFWYLYPSNTSTFPPLSPLVTSDCFWHFSGCGGQTS